MDLLFLLNAKLQFHKLSEKIHERHGLTEKIDQILRSLRNGLEPN